MVPAFSFLQREVKSVLHWAQVYGSLGMELAMAAAGPRLPIRKTESFFRLDVNMYILHFNLPSHYNAPNQLPECKDLHTPAVHLQKFLHHLLQPQQVDELIIGC